MYDGELEFFEDQVNDFEANLSTMDIHIDKSVTDRIRKSTDENQANIFNPATFRDFVLAGYGNACAVTGQLAEGILGMGVDVVYIMEVVCRAMVSHWLRIFHLPLSEANLHYLRALKLWYIRSVTTNRSEATI